MLFFSKLNNYDTFTIILFLLDGNVFLNFTVVGVEFPSIVCQCLSIIGKYKIYTRIRRPHSSFKSTAKRVCKKKNNNNKNIVRFCIE